MKQRSVDLVLFLVCKRFKINNLGYFLNKKNRKLIVKMVSDYSIDFFNFRICLKQVFLLRS